jgi:uncharacterized OB-fold protein
MKKELGIVAYKCKKCGKLHFPFHDRCLVCRGREFEAVKPEGKARLLTFTRIFNLPWGFDERYLTIGVVEFENKVRAMGQINVDESYELTMGMILEPNWEPVRKQYGENIYGLVLKPSIN